MYLGKKREDTIREATEVIKRLTTLETCGIDFGENKEKVKLWLEWFKVEANKINDALDNTK